MVPGVQFEELFDLAALQFALIASFIKDVFYL